MLEIVILEFSVEYNGSTNSECDLEFRTNQIHRNIR